MSNFTVVAPTRSAGLNSESWRSALVTPIKRALAGIHFRRQLRRDMKELMALDDHLLADIGLGRAEIQCLAYCGPHHGKVHCDW